MDLNPSQDQGQPAVPEAARAEIVKRLTTVADWFFWIAGLSVVNTVLSSFSDRSFVLGLGITQVFDAAAQESGGGARVIVFAISVFISGVFVLFGWRARNKARWAFLVGMSFYALDAVLMVLAGVWLGVAIHAYALFCLFKGFAALNELLKLDQVAVPGLSQVKLD